MGGLFGVSHKQCGTTLGMATVKELLTHKCNVCKKPYLTKKEMPLIHLLKINSEKWSLTHGNNTITIEKEFAEKLIDEFDLKDKPNGYSGRILQQVLDILVKEH